MPELLVIRPQPKQEAVLACESDIAIMGGAAGGGKTYTLLLEPLYHQHISGFTAVTFRRTHPMITAEVASGIPAIRSTRFRRSTAMIAWATSRGHSRVAPRIALPICSTSTIRRPGTAPRLPSCNSINWSNSPANNFSRS